MLPILQCTTCKFKNSLKWEVEPNVYICSEFPIRVPDYVGEATKDCPKYEEE